MNEYILTKFDEDLESVLKGLENEDLKLFIRLSAESIACNKPEGAEALVSTFRGNLSKLIDMANKIKDEDSLWYVAGCISLLNEHVSENPKILEKYIDFVNSLKSDSEKKWLSTGFVRVMNETPQKLDYFVDKMVITDTKKLDMPVGEYHNLVEGMDLYMSRFLNLSGLFRYLPRNGSGDLIELVNSV